MSSIFAPHRQKRFFLAALVVAILAYLFWTGSRYPALNEKAMMSGAIQLEDALSFEARFEISADMGLIERVFWSTLNWINTNKKGMIFGVLLAAAFLTALANLKAKSFRGGFSNSLLGLAIGAPLGVCVNCAAPIARGMYTGGMRAETTLSAMVSSPTLNVVVLTMLFSLMPVYMALTKIAVSLIVILLLVPLICRLLPQTQVAPEITQKVMPWASEMPDPAQPAESWFQAVYGVTITYFQNLWYIVKMTVPLMILAGFLGTVVAIALPGELLAGLGFSLFVLLGLVLVGVFLPVPIGFDVVMAGALLSTGLEQGYVMALLFTLGSFSIYSFMIVVQSLGWRAGWLMGGAVAICGAIAGLGAQGYHQWQTNKALEMLLQGANQPAEPPYMWGAAQAAGAPGTTVMSSRGARVSVQPQALAARSPSAETPFTRIEAQQVGIDKPLEFSFRDMWPPFWEGRSLSAGDIDRDGDLDIAIASSEQTLYLYENDGTGHFSRLTPDLGPLEGLMLFNAALADIDNDGWPDLFLTSYGQGNYLWRNVNGSFGAEPPQKIANVPDAPLSLALSFADPDQDGDLDVALGNWAAGWYRRIPGEESRNRILWNRDGSLTDATFSDLPGIPGETLSILFSDFNNDGMVDLIVGNDFDIPDYFYVGDGAGEFDMITHADGLIPHTTTTTMAVKTGDLTGNGVPEIYLAQIAGRSSGVSKKLKMQPLARYCDVIEDPDAKAICGKNMEIKAWYKSGNNFDPTYARKCNELTGRYQAECKAMLVKDLAIQREDASICALIPTSQPVPRAYCDIHFAPPRTITPAEAEASIQQTLRSNVLLESTGPSWIDSAPARGLEIGGWSWDTKFEDFDNDGDLDVYVVNGTWVPNEVSPSNLFYSNDGQGQFTEASGPYGLEDYLMTAAALSIDIDNDGDLDVLTHPVNGPLVLFRNNTQGRGLTVVLEDMAGNSSAIGARVELIETTGHTQVREIQLGGGFMSFDAPRAHFGLGRGVSVQALQLRWPDADTTRIEGPFDDGLVRITRQR